MLTIKEIQKKIKAVSMIERISRGYQEISQETMNKIREATLKNRKFIEELLKVFVEAKNAYVIEKEREEEEKKEKEILFEPQKEKIAIFLSANARFYGQLTLEIWQKALNYLKENKSDLLVIGETGKYLVQKSELNNNFHYFYLDDEKPEDTQIKKIIEFIKNYKDIKVFHGKFKTVVYQEVMETDISTRIPEEKTTERFACLFEPSLEEVLNFFQTELLTAFFTQTFLEHRLSRHATRTVQMYYAQKKAKEKKEELEGRTRKLKWQKLNERYQEISISSQLWK